MEKEKEMQKEERGHGSSNEKRKDERRKRVVSRPMKEKKNV